MKKPQPNLRLGKLVFPHMRKSRGFALIITLVLMVLILLLSVGLLSLSSVELRRTSQSTAMAQAQANARLALQIAIGELQLHAGSDQRITATSDIVGGSNLYTGVWDSRALNPSSPANLYANKDTSFRKWLVSNVDTLATEQANFVTTGVSDPIDLVSQQLVGQNGKIIVGGRVPIPSNVGGLAGHYAYATIDEAVKARVDLGETSVKSTDPLSVKTTALGVGQSPGIDRVKGVTKPAETSFDIVDPLGPGARLMSRMISLNQAEIGYESAKGSFSQSIHDLTTTSLGLMTDAAKGGFKQDLNLMAENTTLPTEYASASIYNKAYGLNIPNSDPKWSEALNFARLFNDTSKMASENGIPSLKSSAPEGWNAATESGPATKKVVTVNTIPPAAPVLLPAVAKVQVVFSFSAHNIWKGTGFPMLGQGIGNHANEYAGYTGTPPTKTKAASSYRYTLHMVYTPVVTLHNPYNVPISFDRLRVSFRNVPFAIQLKIDDEPLYKEFLNFGQFLSANQPGGTTSGQDKVFGFNITTGRLLPGEVKIYSPNIDGMEDWDYAGKNSGKWSQTFADTGGYLERTNRKQEFITASEGWRGVQYGFDLDLLMGGGAGIIKNTHVDEVNGVTYNRSGYIVLKTATQVSADIAPIPDKYIGTSKFTVEMRLLSQSEASDPNNPATSPILSAVEFDYNTLKGLQENLYKDETGQTITAGPFAGASLVDGPDEPMKNWTGVRPFAVFSAYAKTTHSGENGTREDGTYAAKPWSLNNHTGAAAKYKVGTGTTQAAQSHEINLQALEGNISDLFTNNATGQSRFVTGHMSATGRTSGTFHDVPLNPIQSPKDLNGANLAALATSPHFAAPIGNSFAHPLLSTNQIVSGELVDHSYLLNSILYDSYFCSGIQTSGEILGNSREASVVAENFLTGQDSLDDYRFIPYFPEGITEEEAILKLETADAYKHSAGFMLMKGAFNVNSTSVEAWKAVLSGMTGTNAVALAAATGALVETTAATDPKGARFSRFRLPNNPVSVSKDAASDDGEAYWQGMIDIDEKQLEILAQKIVDQVKARGPFLSLGEFVNRQIGSSTDDKALMGALQAAIAETDINVDPTPDSQGNKPGFEIPEQMIGEYGLATPKALAGRSEQGAPGYLTQADILGVIGNAATVRADTFTIRAYGDAVDSTGKVLARAYCEVVVQRLPEYVNPNDLASANPPIDPANVKFGRRFSIQSFRWLAPDEV